MQFPLEVILFLFLLVVAVAVIKLRNLFAGAMLTGIFSLLSAGLFTLMDAVDVAFTEAAVGAGVSTVLILSTLSLTPQTERDRREKPGNIHGGLALLIVVLVGAALLYGTTDMPAYGDPSAPIHHHVVPRYISDSPREIGIPNFVTSILASYRGYDTFGELSVIFTAGIGVMALLANRRRAARNPSVDKEPSA